MAIRAYSSLDAGAPVISGAVSIYAALRTVMMACLVNGFGSKPAAGWAVGHDVADGCSLFNGDGYINIVNSDVNHAVVYIMESITNGSTALAAGTNRRSAQWFDGSNSVVRHYFYCAGVAASSTWWWSVVADERTAHVSIYRVNSSNTGWGGGLSFGAYSNVNGLTGPASFYALGGSTVLNGLVSFGIPSSATVFHGSILRHPITGLISQGVDPRIGGVVATLSSAVNGPVNKSHTVVDAITPQRAYLLCAGAGLSGTADLSSAIYGGRLRGLQSDPVLTSMTTDNVVGVFSLPFGNTFRTRIEPITLPNGKVWIPYMLGFNSSFNAFVSMAAEDWL